MYRLFLPVGPEKFPCRAAPGVPAAGGWPAGRSWPRGYGVPVGFGRAGMSSRTFSAMDLACVNSSR
jgi:hypothetical protein